MEIERNYEFHPQSDPHMWVCAFIARKEQELTTSPQNMQGILELRRRYVPTARRKPIFTYISTRESVLMKGKKFPKNDTNER